MRNQFIKKYLDVQKNEIVAKVPLVVEIDKKLHTELEDNGDSYSVVGMVKIINPETQESWNTPFMFIVQLPKSGEVEETPDYLRITYQPDDVIMRAEFKMINADVTTIRNLLENRTGYAKQSIEEHVYNLWDLYRKAVGNVPLLYVELPLSEMYRDPEQPSRPFRLTGKKDYSKALAVSIPQAVQYRGNIYRSIAHGYAAKGIAQAVSSNTPDESKRDVIIDSVLSTTEKGEENV